MLVAWIALGPAALAAHADEVEVVSLRYRTFDQVAPVLRPLIEPQGALTGMQSTLVIRSSRRNIEEIKRVLASVDTLPRRLLISVRQTADAAADDRDVGLTGRIGNERGGVVIGTTPGTSGVQGRVVSSRSASDERVTQQVQTIDGAVALIQVGQSVPIPQQIVQRTVNGVIVTDTVAYRDTSTGFTVIPRVTGEQVTLEISPQREQPVTGSLPNGPVAVSSQRIVTTMTGRLGEWLEIAGSFADGDMRERGVLSSAEASRRDTRRVWVKVDALP